MKIVPQNEEEWRKALTPDPEAEQSSLRGKAIHHDDSYWREKLTPEQFRIMREKGTEAPFSGKLLHSDKNGTYMCSACGNALFKSDAKFDSGTGWPSFDEAISGAVKQIPDYAHGMPRTEIVCARCNSHLGHVFDDLPAQAGGRSKTGKRFCINSVCLDLEEEI